MGLAGRPGAPALAAPSPEGAPSIGKPVATRMPGQGAAPGAPAAGGAATPFQTMPQAGAGPMAGIRAAQLAALANGDPRAFQMRQADPRSMQAIMGQQQGAGGGLEQTAPRPGPPWATQGADPRGAMIAEAAPGAAQGAAERMQMAQRYAALAEAQRNDPRMAQAMGARQSDPRAMLEAMKQRAASLQGGADPKRMPLELPRPVAPGGAAPSKQLPGRPAPPWVR
jgi:hypothetical protein